MVVASVGQRIDVVVVQDLVRVAVVDQQQRVGLLVGIGVGVGVGVGVSVSVVVVDAAAVGSLPFAGQVATGRTLIERNESFPYRRGFAQQTRRL